MSAGVVSELAVLFKADTSALEKGMAKARQDIKDTGAAAERGGGLIGGLVGGLGKLGLAGLGIGAIKGAVSGVVGSFGDLIGAAEAAGDAKARLDLVLGSDLSGVMQDNATIANQLGMTKTAYLEAAGSAANYLTNLGLGKDAAAEMAMGMTELAPKLAAFANVDPSQVTDALQKGVGGSTRGLKELGIAINDDLLKGLDDASKSAEIFRQIQEQSGPASAAWADNQGDVANSMARVSAAMDDAKAAIGERLLPIIAPLVQWFADRLPAAIDMVITAGSNFIANVQAVWDKLVSFFTDTQGKGESFRDKLVGVWTTIKDAVGRVVDWFNANVKPILVGVFDTVAAKLATFKQQFDDKFGGIRGAVQAVVDWFQTNVAPTIAAVFDRVMAVVGPVVAFLAAHMDEIKAIVGGAIDFAVGVFRVGFNLLKGIVETVMAVIRGDWSGAWDAIKATAANVVPGIKQALGGLWEYLKGLGKIALDAALGIGSAIVDGIKKGIQDKWDAVTGWIGTQMAKIPAGIRKLLGIASPSKVFARIGHDMVAGLVVGIGERTADVIGVTGALAEALIAAARDALGTHSPSTAFADIGGDVVAGLSGGLDGVRDATSRLATDVSDGVAGAADAAVSASARFADIGNVTVTIDAQPLQQAVDDMKTAAGDLRLSLLDLQPAAEGAGDKLGTLGSGATIVDMLNNILRSGQSLVPTLMGIGGASLLASGSSGLGALAVALTGPVGAAIAGAIAIGAALYAGWTTNFGGIREKTLEVVAVVMAKWDEVKAKLSQVFGEIWADLQPLRDRFAAAWQSIQEKVSAVVSWIADNVKPLIVGAFDGVMGALDGFLTFWRANSDSIIAIVTGLWDAVAGIFNGAWALLSGIVRTGIALLTGDFSGAGRIIVETVRGWWEGVGQAFGGLAKAIGGVATIVYDNLVAPMVAAGAAMVDGLKKGIQDKWDAVTGWVGAQIAKIPLSVRKLLGIASPSKVFTEIGEQIVAGLRIGLEGIAIIGAIINDGLAKAIGSMDVENFEMIHRLTTAILGIFKDAAEGIKSLLSFDIVTSADEIAAAFGRLVDVFMVAVKKMRELSTFAGRGAQPGQGDSLNMWDIANIERFTGAIEATLGVMSGALDILEKLAKVAMPGAGAITALIPFLQEIANAAAVFEQPLGKDEDAIAVFERGSIVAGHIATFAKNVADLTGLKFGAISATFAVEVQAAATAAGQAWAAVAAAAGLWGDMESMLRDKLITGVKAYAEVVGAAVSILKGVGDLDLSEAVIATAAQMRAAADASVTAVTELGRIADWWIRAGAEVTGPIVDGIKAYAEAAAAAVGMLQTAGNLALDKMIAATAGQLHTAADVAAMALGELLRVIGQFADMATEARTALVTAVKDYADAAGAAIGMLSAAAGLDFTKAVAVTREQLQTAADAAAMALGELMRVAGAFVAMGAEAAGPLVAGVKAFADGAGAAIDLLIKGAGGINALGEIKSLAGVQPGLIRAVLGNLKLALDTVLANLPTFKPEQLARLKDMGDMAGVFDPLAKAATGINALGAIKSLAGVQPRMIRAILGGVNLAVKEVSAGAGTFEDGAVAKVKAWGEASAATLGALTTAADGLTKLGGKIAIPEDLSARVAMLVSAMRTVVQGMAAALSGDGAISVDVAKAGADVAEAVGRIGEAFAPIFDAINAALESPFGRIKAKGAKGDTWRQNIADGIKASLVAAVTALSEALATMPTIDVPDALVTGVEKLATVYDRILDILGKLDGIKIDAKALAALAAVPGILAGGLNVSGSGGTLTMSGGAPGGGITINNTVTPTFMPMPVTINNTVTAPITVGPRVVQAIAVEVVNQFDTEIKLKPSGL